MYHAVKVLKNEEFIVNSPWLEGIKENCPSVLSESSVVVRQTRFMNLKAVTV